VEAWNALHGNVAGTLLWMLATDSYPDYDGYEVYTTKKGVEQPHTQPAAIDGAMIDGVREPIREERVRGSRLVTRVVPSHGAELFKVGLDVRGRGPGWQGVAGLPLLPSQCQERGKERCCGGLRDWCVCVCVCAV
jgi:hypothetical protein